MTGPRFAVFVYDGVEPIDIGATVGVLSMARRVAPSIQAWTVAPRAGLVRCANGLSVMSDYGFDRCPPADALVVTGGPGWKAEAERAETLDFIRRMAAGGTVASVSTGGMILAATGLLDGRRATTRRAVTSGEVSPLLLLRDRYPRVEVVEARLVDEGPIVTAGGVTLAIDATLHLLQRFLGEAVAAETARILEYTSAWRANQASFKMVVAARERVQQSSAPGSIGQAE